MGRCAALAAAGLLALLVVAAACKPSSLTPFTGWRQEETETSGINGSWVGQTFSSGVSDTIVFTIASDQFVDWTLKHPAPSGCGKWFTTGGAATQIEGNTFTIDGKLELQGRLVVEGTFSSDTECSGTYHFEAVRVSGDCPTSGSGTFVATKSN
jgi:hypothetical protein